MRRALKILYLLFLILLVLLRIKGSFRILTLLDGQTQLVNCAFNHGSFRVAHIHLEVKDEGGTGIELGSDADSVSGADFKLVDATLNLDFSGWWPLQKDETAYPENILYANGAVLSKIWHRKIVALAWWPVFLLALIPGAIWMQRRHRYSRFTQKGKCNRCGYDLRATPERCPECGTVPEAYGNQHLPRSVDEQ